MEGQERRKLKNDPWSLVPYKRRSDAEYVEIAQKIKSGEFTIRGACWHFGICRNTLKKALIRISVSSLEQGLSKQIFSEMNEEKQIAALQRRVKELTKALESARLKNDGLETMILVAERELQIKIRKKAGAKRSTK